MSEVVAKTKLTLWQFIRFALRKWYVIAVALAVGVAIGIYQYSSVERKYTATYSFMVNEDKGGLTQVGSILSSVGLGGLAGGGGETSPEAIIEIAKAEAIAMEVLTDTVRHEGKPVILADLVWANYEEKVLQTIQQKFNISEDAIPEDLFSTKNADSYWRNVYLKSIKNVCLSNSSEALIVTDRDKSTGIMKISVNTTDENLSYHLARKWYQHLSDYYIQKSVEPQRRTFEVLKDRADSLQGRIYSLTNRSARLQDTRKSLFLASDNIEGGNVSREIAISNAAYGKVIENLEIARFGLSNRTPFFAVLESSMLPLAYVRPALLSTLLLYLILFGLLGVVAVAALFVLKYGRFE